MSTWDFPVKRERYTYVACRIGCGRPSRSRVASFIIFLTITTALVISLLLGHFGPLGWMGLVVMFGVQAVAYVWSAGYC
jgi:hypothetical protein